MHLFVAACKINFRLGGSFTKGCFIANLCVKEKIMKMLDLVLSCTEIGTFVPKLSYPLWGVSKCSRKITTCLFVSVFVAFFAACSTPTLPSDDSDESSSSVLSSSSRSLSSSDSRGTGTIESSSSSYSVEQNCSALLEGTDDWSWDVPKECRFNPDITYGSMTDSRDGQIYKTVKIGDQTWMAENMNYADSTKTPSMQPRSWCYNNKAENCAVAGRLYTWEAANDACPEGWHLPTQMEWNTLFTEVGGQSIAGKILKSQTGWGSYGNGTDGVGFSALPAGDRVNYGEFYNGGHRAIFWSATENSGNRAYNVCLSNDGEDVRQEGFPYKNNWFSVRCLQD